MKFNLKSFAEKNNEGNTHTEQKLNKERSEAPTSITQKQLERDRVPEKNETMEALLDAKRTGSADRIIEKSLNDSKSGLHTHRNPKASAGALNKVEEQRLSKKKQEDEKYEAASSTPSSKKWWDKLKAGSNKKVVVASEFDIVDETDFEDENRWGRMDDSAWAGADDEGVLEDNDTEVDLPEDMEIETTDGSSLTVSEIRPVDSPIAKGLYVAFDITPQGANIDEAMLKEQAYNMVLSEGYGYLADVPEFTPDSFRVKADQLIARLVGDEYYPRGHEEEAGVDLMGDNPFVVSELQETDVDGIVLGTVHIDGNSSVSIEDMSDSDIRSQVMDAILKKHENITVEDDGIDLDKISSGEINFVGEVSRRRPKRHTPESWENVVGKPIASRDFEIVVLSDTKKN